MKIHYEWDGWWPVITIVEPDPEDVPRMIDAQRYDPEDWAAEVDDAIVARYKAAYAEFQQAESALKEAIDKHDQERKSKRP